MAFLVSRFSGITPTISLFFFLWQKQHLGAKNMIIFSTASIRRTVISVTRNTHKLYVFSNVWDLYIWKNSVKEYSLFNSSIDIFNYVTRRVIFSFSIENCFWFHFRKYGISVWIPNSFKSPKTSLNLWTTTTTSSASNQLCISSTLFFKMALSTLASLFLLLHR